MRSPVVILLVSIFIGSCEMQPQSGELARDMVVQTRYDEASVNSTANIFNTYSTFVIREDTLGFVSSSSNATYLLESDLNIPNGYVVPVINKVKQNFTARGFGQVEESENPDFAVNIVILDDFSFFQTVSYPGFYPGGYYGYYGYYFPIVTSYYSQFATMVIEVVDIKNYAANGNQYKIIWKASIGDLYLTVDLRSKTLEAIDQAFIQSPYVNRN